jgi:hypothetical protein
VFCGFSPSSQSPPSSGVSLVMTELAEHGNLQTHPTSKCDSAKQTLERCLGLSKPLPSYNPPPMIQDSLIEAMNAIQVPDYMKWNYAEMFIDTGANTKFFNPANRFNY